MSNKPCNRTPITRMVSNWVALIMERVTEIEIGFELGLMACADKSAIDAATQLALPILRTYGIECDLVFADAKTITEQHRIPCPWCKRDQRWGSTRIRVLGRPNGVLLRLGGRDSES